jgi:hypothetical protein
MAVTALLVFTAVLLQLALLWKVYQLCRAPHDRPLRAVTLCVVCATALFSLGLRSVAGGLDSLLGQGAGKLVQNSLLLATVYWLLCFYVYSAAEPRQATRRVRWEAVPLAVAVSGLTVATLATPSSVRGRVYGAADMRVDQVALFYVVVGLYLVYALSTALWWTWRYARMSRRPLSTGLWFTATALGCMVVASAGRAVFDVVRWRGDTVPVVLNQIVGLLFALGVPLFVVGVCYPGVVMRLAALRIWWQHRQAYHRLRPLWTLLHEAYPQDALNRFPTSRWRERLSLRGVHRRYYRRVIECRDGLVRISPYLAQQGVGDEAVPSVLAERLRSALRDQAAGGTAGSQAVALALPEEDGLDADVRQLVALSDALASR